MKGFLYDTLLDEENICNLDRERNLLGQGVNTGKKLIVYGPRNFGKTSLVKNVVIPHFQKGNNKNFVLFADLMEVKTLDSIHQRIQLGFEKAFSRSFPAKNLLETAKQFITQLRPEISMDPLTGQSSLSLGASSKKPHVPFMEILELIQKKISPKMPALIVLDEFQDIAFIPETQGLFRQSLQEFKKTPIILMGSKRHILSNLFAKPNAPLAGFGEDIEFGPIAYEDYHAYIQERFDGRKLIIDSAHAKILQDALFRVPEAMNIICADLFETHQNQAIAQKHIYQSMDRVVEKRRSRFEEWLSHFSPKEEEILTALAKVGQVKHPTAKEFLKLLSVTPRTVSLSLSHFMDNSVVVEESEGFRIADPLLFHFLKKFR